ncbi:MAG: SAM-dependent chlorinase/fluorinase [Planctomycetes bacterium]|nr:SAM-dependent chlorinase/fluorinase [Planctomycetota bacterium]
MTRPCITLLTDFGLDDSYVGQMKGVITTINPDAIVIDLTHDIRPQHVLQAAITLADSLDAFPAGTIHVVVVDPGVGSSRRAIGAEVGSQKFVCPDNGLLSLILRHEPVIRAVQLDVPQWWRSGMSSTFHGRDLFAPVAAAWSLGRDLSEFGSAITRPLIELPIPEPVVRPTGISGTREIEGHVITIDHFGNLITNVSRNLLPADAGGVEIAFQNTAVPISNCYADGRAGDVVALFGSTRRLELAVVNGNAAEQLSAGLGEPVAIRWKEVDC